MKGQPLPQRRNGRRWSDDNKVNLSRRAAMPTSSGGKMTPLASFMNVNCKLISNDKIRNSNVSANKRSSKRDGKRCKINKS